MRLLRLLTILLAGLSGLPALAATPVLVVTAGGVARQFTSDQLLARRDAATIPIPRDPAYGRAMSYRAVPLRALLSALPPDAADTIQARATDGFVAEIPRALIGGAALPWVAVEDLPILGPLSRARPSQPVHSTWSGKTPSVTVSPPRSGSMPWPH